MVSETNKQLPLVYDLDLTDFENLLRQMNQPSYRAKQIWSGLYKQLWQNPDDFSTLPEGLREDLNEVASFSGLSPRTTLTSSDGETEKILFELPDGKSIETVHMRYNDRQSICVSSQAGCAMGCVFCATGQMGFKRNLTSGEIVEQVIHFARRLKQQGKLVTNIVIMGMGEPFNNYDATMAAISRLNHPDSMGLGERRFTISTVGLVPVIIRFAEEHRQMNLAVSLHAANDALRSSLLPVNKAYPLADLIQACRYYIEQTNRRITFEWALIDGVNDRKQDALELASLLKGLLAHVNLILLNPTHKFTGRASTSDKARFFCQTLEASGIACTIRLRRGIDIMAGCGQLAESQIK